MCRYEITNGGTATKLNGLYLDFLRYRPTALNTVDEYLIHPHNIMLEFHSNGII